MSGAEGLAQQHSSRKRPEDVGEATGARLFPTISHYMGFAGLIAPTASRKPSSDPVQTVCWRSWLLCTLLHQVWGKRAGEQYHQEQPPEHGG